uniref:Uncharacterized protein n=1 Tax=Cacopsylla melanoneura TaxID=428564 RepID=A0A8D9AZE1_9HEMI
MYSSELTRMPYTELMYFIKTFCHNVHTKIDAVKKIVVNFRRYALTMVSLSRIRHLADTLRVIPFNDLAVKMKNLLIDVASSQRTKELNNQCFEGPIPQNTFPTSSFQFALLQFCQLKSAEFKIHDTSLFWDLPAAFYSKIPSRISRSTAF